MICVKCKIDKPDTEFRYSRKTKVKHKRCVTCQKVNTGGRYYNDPVFAAKKRADATKRIKENLTYVRDYLRVGCIDCENTDIRVLEFDHRPSEIKISGVLKMAREGASIARLNAEIRKCDVRCRNCHAIQTYERAGWTFADPDILTP